MRKSWVIGGSLLLLISVACHQFGGTEYASAEERLTLVVSTEVESGFEEIDEIEEESRDSNLEELELHQATYMSTNDFSFHEVITEVTIATIEEPISEMTESLEVKIMEELCQLLQQEDSIFPNGTKITGVLFFDGEIDVDFTKELLNYGGNAYEEELIRQISEVVFSYEEVNKLTILIDGKSQNLVEGSVIKGYTKEEWEERMVKDVQ